MTRNPFSPILIIFFVVALLIVILKFSANNLGNLFNVLFVGNLVLFVATALSFRLYEKGINAKGTHGFIRMIYSAMMLKMAICIAAVLVYAFAFKPVNKIAVAVFFVLYFIYTFAEIKIVTRLNKDKKNA